MFVGILSVSRGRPQCACGAELSGPRSAEGRLRLSPVFRALGRRCLGVLEITHPWLTACGLPLGCPSLNRPKNEFLILGRTNNENGQAPFRSTWKPWLKPPLQGAKWISQPSTVGGTSFFLSWAVFASSLKGVWHTQNILPICLVCGCILRQAHAYGYLSCKIKKKVTITHESFLLVFISL